MSYYDLKIDRIPVGRTPTEVEPGVWNHGVLPAPPAPTGVSDNPQPFLQIRDNGLGGDGVWMSVANDEMTGEDPAVLGFHVPDKSLPLLIAALHSIQSMREAQAVAEDEE